MFSRHLRFMPLVMLHTENLQNKPMFAKTKLHNKKVIIKNELWNEKDHKLISQPPFIIFIHPKLTKAKYTILRWNEVELC
jgi:hypothetical protein